jgi:anti-sigma B factor antagonist
MAYLRLWRTGDNGEQGSPGERGGTVTGNTEERNFQIDVLEGLPVVTPPSEINLENAQQLRAALVYASSEHTTLVVDLSANEFCDSSGISELVMALRNARKQGGELRLVMGGSAVQRVFKMTGVDDLFRIFHGVSEALAAQPLPPLPGAQPSR